MSDPLTKAGINLLYLSTFKTANVLVINIIFLLKITRKKKNNIYIYFKLIVNIYIKYIFIFIPSYIFNNNNRLMNHLLIKH